MKLHISTTLLLSLLLSARIEAQSDSAAYATAVAQFHHMLVPETGLYNGGEYVDYESTLFNNGQPYFGNDLPRQGWITYDGIRYDHVQFWYDIVQDKVVLRAPNQALKLSLHSDRIKAFQLGGLDFVRIVRDSTNGLRTGFYEILYTGRETLLRRSGKNVQEYITSNGIQRIVYADSSYYLYLNGQYLEVNRKRSLLRALNGKKRELQAFIRKNKLSFKEGKDETLTQIITYYASL
jgi:hypothetical protein